MSQSTYLFRNNARNYGLVMSLTVSANALFSRGLVTQGGGLGTNFDSPAKLRLIF